MKPCICVGDKTSGGGVVISGSPTSTINDKQMARVGDKATCTKKNHPRTVTIVSSSDPTVITDGSPQAFHGDPLSCGCTVIASQFSTNSDPQGGGDGGGSSAGANATASAVIANGETPSQVTSKYDQYFQLKDENTGDVLKDRFYKIHYSGGTIEGYTDNSGYTQKVASEEAETVEVEIFDANPAPINPYWDH